jgi:hypothetical protein
MNVREYDGVTRALRTDQKKAYFIPQTGLLFALAQMTGALSGAKRAYNPGESQTVSERNRALTAA